MQLHLVLNEDEKKERFKASLLKKRKEDSPKRLASTQANVTCTRVQITEEGNPLKPVF